MPFSDFLIFCQTCEKVRDTTKKLEKLDILSTYFRSLDKRSLPIACLFLSGLTLSPPDEKTLNIGYSNLSATLAVVTSTNEKDALALYKKHGDFGFVTEELFTRKTMVPILPSPLTLTRIEQAFRKIANQEGQGSSSSKKDILTSLMLDASPLESRYLVKVMTGEMRIGVVGGLVQEALARAYNARLTDVRRSVLVTGDIGATAILASEGLLKRASPRLLHPISFMLADTMQTSREIAEYFGREMFADYKYDGIRAQAHKSGDQVKIFSRRLEAIENSFPEIIAELKVIRHDLIVDGEIVPFKHEKPLSFQLLQRRLRRKKLDPVIKNEIPVVYFAFDLLYVDGVSLLDEPFTKRRELLESLGLSGSLRLSHLARVKTEEEIQGRFEESKELGYEGLVLKDPDSYYSPGKRGKNWVKLKKELDTLDVVVVAVEQGHGKRAGVLSDYTFAVRHRNELKIIGKAYSGLTDNEIKEYTEFFKKITVKDQGLRRVVKPEVILEVAFDNIQRGTRHNSGYALRFPRIKRIRTDKTLEQIDTLEKVEKIYERQHFVQS